MAARVKVLRDARDPWRSGGPGICFRELGLERVSFTCFQLDADVRFERHAHEAEQITYVLEGHLHFRVRGREHVLGPGDGIAIPSGVPHSVWAGAVPVVAVDAWSPPPGHLDG